MFITNFLSMKRIVSVIMTLVVFTCCSCKQERKMVEEAAYQYSYAMANYNVDEAEKYATEETKETTLKTARFLVQRVDSTYIKSDTPATIDIINVEMVNDSMAVATYHKITPLKDFSGTVDMRKRDGKWYAHVTPRTIPDSLKY